MVASAGGDVARSVLTAVAQQRRVRRRASCCRSLGVPNTGADDREPSASGEYDGFSAWESDLLALIAELIESTGKPIINVPDLPMRKALYACGGRYSPVVLPSPRAAALALDRMAWYGDYRRRHAAGPSDDHD